MPVNAVAENVCGTLGTIFWCIQLIPQVWKSYHEKTTFGLSPLLVFTWALASLPLGVYNISTNVNIPLILQPQLFGTLGAICWIQCLYYDRHWSRTKSILTFLTFEGLLGSLQVAFVFAVRHGLAEGNERPLQFFGVMCAVLLFGGLIPQFYEIWKLKEVLGISMIFMFIDLLGGVFSVLSLAFKPSLDPLLAFSYISVVVLDGLIIMLKMILNPLAARRRAKQGDMNMNPAAEKVDGHPSNGPVNDGKIGDSETATAEVDIVPPRSIEAIELAPAADNSTRV